MLYKYQEVIDGVASSPQLASMDYIFKQTVVLSEKFHTHTLHKEEHDGWTVVYFNVPTRYLKYKRYIPSEFRW